MTVHVWNLSIMFVKRSSALFVSGVTQTRLVLVLTVINEPDTVYTLTQIQYNGNVM